MRHLHASILVACALCSLHCGGDEGDTGTGAASQSGASTAGPSGSGASGAAGSTSGQAGAGGTGTGATGGGGGTADPCKDRLICDDFEDDDLGAEPKAPWQSSTNKGTIAVDGEHVHSGKQAVKVTTEAGQYKSALFFTEGAPAFPIAGNVAYGRMMIYMDQTANDGVHWTMIQGQGPLEGHPGVTSLYRYGGMWAGKMMANYETSGAATDCWNNSETVMPTGKWTCMEWRFDGPKNDMQFWLDGQDVADMHVTQEGMGCGGHDLADQWLAPTFDRMSLGWESYQQDDARAAWIDDVIIDDQPIGCPP